MVIEMVTEKVLTGSVVVIDLKPDGTLRASNVERQYTLSDGNVILARPVERDVLTAETLGGVLPDQAALALRVQELQQAVQTVTAERDAALAARDALQSEKDAAAINARLSVSPAAARVVLRNAGLLVAVEAAVEAADPHSDLRIFWEYSEVWRRESPFIAQMGAALGLTVEQIDDLFAQAATL